MLQKLESAQGSPYEWSLVVNVNSMKMDATLTLTLTIRTSSFRTSQKFVLAAKDPTICWHQIKTMKAPTSERME